MLQMVLNHTHTQRYLIWQPSIFFCYQTITVQMYKINTSGSCVAHKYIRSSFLRKSSVGASHWMSVASCGGDGGRYNSFVDAADCVDVVAVGCVDDLWADDACVTVLLTGEACLFDHVQWTVIFLCACAAGSFFGCGIPSCTAGFLSGCPSTLANCPWCKFPAPADFFICAVLPYNGAADCLWRWDGDGTCGGSALPIPDGPLPKVPLPNGAATLPIFEACGTWCLAWKAIGRPLLPFFCNNKKLQKRNRYS